MNSATHSRTKELVILRDGGRSPYSGKQGEQLHEEFVSRADVMAMLPAAREAIFVPWNTVILTASENVEITSAIHNAARRRLVEYYGRAYIEERLAEFCAAHGYKYPTIVLNAEAYERITQ